MSQEWIEARELRARFLELGSRVVPEDDMHNVAVFNQVLDDGNKIFVTCNQGDFINALPDLSRVDVFRYLVSDGDINLLFLPREVLLVSLDLKPLAFDHFPECICRRRRTPQLGAPDFRFVAAHEGMQFSVIRLPCLVCDMVVHRCDISFSAGQFFGDGRSSAAFNKHVGIVDVGEVKRGCH